MDFGVDVKRGNLLGRRSGEAEQSVGAGEFGGGERWTDSRDAARGGGIVDCGFCGKEV